MASVRKKYNAAAKAQQNKARVLRLADFKIRSALKGATVAYNSSWGSDAQYYPTGMERIVNLLNGDIDTACGALVQIDIRWRVYITINCQTEYDEEYIYLLPVIDKVCQMQRLEDEIEKLIIPEALKKRNKAHVKDWGYWGEIV
jgi:hypothetical protein